MRTEARGRAAQVNSDDGLDGLETAASQSQLEKIGTLSFPVRVCKDKACPIKAGPIYENTHRIEEIIRRRSPALLLCAGWSVPARDLQSISALTEQVKTVVVLEAMQEKGTHVNYRIVGGKQISMGEQIFSKSKEASAENLCRLEAALSERSFTFLERKVLLFVCGEITIMGGRPPRVGFRPGVPENLRREVRAAGTMILNPTHTRMKRWEVETWREYLSSDGHTCVSASNWNLCAQGSPSPTLHTLWHDGQKQSHDFEHENDFLCYREWHLPQL